jgi:hypothetical protein
MILYSDAPGYEKEQKHRINTSDHFRCKKNLTSGYRVPELMLLFRFLIVEVMIVCQKFTWHSRRVPHRRLPDVRSPLSTGRGRIGAHGQTPAQAAFPRSAAWVATIQALLKWLVGIQEGRVEREGASRAMARLHDHLFLPASQKRRCANSECYDWLPVIVILTV